MAGWGKAEQGRRKHRAKLITVAAYLPITLANSKKVLINAQDLLKRNCPAKSIKTKSCKPR